MSSLYVHIPFCLSKCHYCSFSSCGGEQDLYGRYVTALEKELFLLAQEGECHGLDTLFIGGGTPTCLPSSLLCGLVQHCLEIFGANPGVEVSVEANPGTVEKLYLEDLLNVGVNRLSLGVQSFDNGELSRLGRVHDKQVAISAVEDAKSAGFTNINLDLMYGLPSQTAASWRTTLAQGISLCPTHLSLYQLTIEPDTPFFSLIENSTFALPPEEEILQMDAITNQLCRSAGLHIYETSNFALKGYQCRHNLNYWINEEYFAAGASAVSYRKGIREKRISDPAEYINRIEKNSAVVVESEQLSREASFRETVIMGLRLVQGVSRKTLQTRYGFELEEYYGRTLRKLLDQEFLKLTDTHLVITTKGWPLANQILAELV